MRKEKKVRKNGKSMSTFLYLAMSATGACAGFGFTTLFSHHVPEVLRLFVTYLGHMMAGLATLFVYELIRIVVGNDE